ncbi:MAG: glycosyltransferase family 4 protein [Nitrososphaerota archaeon]|nr:glycosyltransferase family 4 protein [Nitrososphaerota archaeon]
MPRIYEFLYDIASTTRILTLAKTFDVIYFKSTTPAFLFLLVPRRKATVVFGDGGPLPRYLSSRLVRLMSKVMRRFVFSRANGIELAGGVSFGKQMKIEFGLSDRNVLVCPDGVDTTIFSQGTPSDRDSLRPRMILSVGNIHPVKNQLTLLRCLPQVLPTHPDIEVVLVGPKKDLRYLSQMSQYLLENSLNCVRLTGIVTQAELMSYYNTADVFVHMSVAEGTSRAILEAMALGKPIVASSIPENLECAPTGSEMLFVSPFDVNGLAKCINNLLDDPEKTKSLGSRAAITAAEKFDFAVVFSTRLEFLRLMVDKSRAQMIKTRSRVNSESSTQLLS